MTQYFDGFSWSGEFSANGWIEDAGDLDANGSVGSPTTSSARNRARYSSALDSSDHHVEATITPNGSNGPWGGVTARQASSANTYYYGLYDDDDNNWTNAFKIRKIVDGSETILDESGNPGWGASGAQTISLTVDGATQVLYNHTHSVELCSAADTAITSGTYAGVSFWSNVATVDDWSAEDLGGLVDNFNRADGGLGPNWTVDAGTVNISSGKANDDSSGSGGRARYTGTQLDSADHEVAATVDCNSIGERVGVSARQASSTFTAYTAGILGEGQGADSWAIHKVVSGTYTLLDGEEMASGGNTGRAITLTVDGSSISGEMVGASTLSATDSAITSGLYAGIVAGWATDNGWNDWSAADLGAATLNINVSDCLDAIALFGTPQG